MPANVDLERASTVGVGWISAVQGLRQRLFKILKAGDKGAGQGLLVYSAATSTGWYTLQQAKIDYPEAFVVATASKQHHKALRKLGADVRALGREIN